MQQPKHQITSVWLFTKRFKRIHRQSAICVNRKSRSSVPLLKRNSRSIAVAAQAYQSLQAHPPPKRDLRQSQKSLERTIAEAQFASNRISRSSLPIASIASTAKRNSRAIAIVAQA
jgi:hypothetical protein